MTGNLSVELFQPQNYHPESGRHGDDKHLECSFLMNLRLGILFIFSTVSISAQQLPAPPKLHVTNINPKTGYFNEPAIAVNPKNPQQDRKSTRLNSSHANISY